MSVYFKISNIIITKKFIRRKLSYHWCSYTWWRNTR